MTDLDQRDLEAAAKPVPEPNLLYYGDNLDVLQYVKDETVDLVYLDPPFKSNKDYNILMHGKKAAAQIKAFEDTWTWDESAALALWETVNGGGAVAEVLLAFEKMLPESDMLAYLAMMAPRIVALRRVLKPTGSLYLHCDPTASHYLKVLLDAIFDPRHFLNEIVWCYDTGGRSTSSFPKKHDIILRYSKTPAVAFYYDQVALERDPTTMHETVVYDEDGRPYQRNIKAGKEYRYYLDKGVLPNDWWTDIQALNPAAKERLGYPTQKPEALLERIIKASSQEGDLVLDPFCGCGTTVAVAERLKRRWVGIDITHLAVGLIKHRLSDTYGEKISATYRVIGEPTDLEGAARLAQDDPWQFQAWALGRPATSADHDVRGRSAHRSTSGD